MESGAAVDVADSRGATAAWHACVQDHAAVLEVLLQYGAAGVPAQWRTDVQLLLRRLRFSLTCRYGMLQATNRLSEAEPLMRRALAIREKASFQENPRCLKTCVSHVDMYKHNTCTHTRRQSVAR